VAAESALPTAVLDALPDGVALRDLHGRLTYENRAMREQFAPALAAARFLCGDVRMDLGLDCPTASTLADGQPHESVVEGSTLDGSPVYIEYRAHPLRDATGALTGVLTLVRNVTRPAVEARTGELAQARETLARILDGIPDAIALVDPDGGVLYRNSAARDLPEPARARIRAALTNESLVAAARTITRVVEWTDPAGETRTFETFAFPVPWMTNGRTLTIVYTRDVTSRRALERQALRNERLAVVGELAAGLAHEIRTPLTSISNSVKLLEGALPAAADGDARLLLGILAKESKRLSGLLTDFLKFARPRPPKPLASDLNALAREAARIARGSRPQADAVTVDLDLADTLPAAPVDPDQLQQALLNILVNALDAAASSAAAGRPARVTVATAGPGQSGSAWIVRVADTGPGIDPEARARLFEPFFSRKPDGNGLGLAISKRIVEAHAGRIEVASAPGEGATFSIVLPAASALAPLEGA
jgi:signal transduction histidine kinase